MATKYFDPNQDFYRKVFAKAVTYDEHVATAKEEHKDRWKQALEAATLTDEQRALVGSFERKMNVLVLSGVWCGDCVRQCPIIHRIAEASDLIDLRFIDREEDPKLRDLLRVNGATKVPVTLFLSEDFFEIGRFGDRTVSRYRLMAKEMVGAACPTGLVPEKGHDIEEEIREWVDEFERMELILRISPLLAARYAKK